METTVMSSNAVTEIENDLTNKVVINKIEPVSEEDNSKFECAVCQLRENGICEFYKVNNGKGAKCDGIIKGKNEINGMVIDQNLICLKTRGDYKTCIVSADNIDRLVNGNAALMIGNVAVIFDNGKNTISKESDIRG